MVVDPRSPLLLAGIDALVDAIAERVVEKLRAGSQPDFLDQHSSPLGARRHCAAIRAGKLPGMKIGRRWVARRVDVENFLRQVDAPTQKPKAAAAEPPKGDYSEAALARRLNLIVGGKRDR